MEDTTTGNNKNNTTTNVSKEQASLPIQVFSSFVRNISNQVLTELAKPVQKDDETSLQELDNLSDAIH